MLKARNELTIAEAADIIHDVMGLWITPERYTDLEQRLANIAKARREPHWQAAIEDLKQFGSSAKDFDLIAQHLTIGESYFFRHQPTFSSVKKTIIPNLIANNPAIAGGNLKVWSAACSSGEEPYSLAITLREYFPDSRLGNIQVIASDISPNALQFARQGRYRDWSFRGVDDARKDAYFNRQADDSLAVRPEIRNMVHFKQINLVEDNYPALGNGIHGFDIIFCRNVFIYFSSAKISQILDRFYRALNPGGWLVLGHADRLMIGDSRFIAYLDDDTPLFQRPPTTDIQSALLPGLIDTAPPIPADAEWSLHPEIEQPAQSLSEPEQEPDTATARQHPASQQTASAISIAQQASSADEKITQAIALADSGNFTQALQLCTAALEQNQIHAVAHYLRGTLLHEIGEYSSARESLRKALFLDANLPMAHLAMAQLEMSENRVNEAKRHLRNTLHALQGLDDEVACRENPAMSIGKLRTAAGLLSQRVGVQG